MQIIAVSNQKGGCGKTTSAISLAAALAETGQRVLLVDLDPQGHTTLGLGHVPDRFERTVYHLMVNDGAAPSDVAVGTSVVRLDLMPGDARLTEVDREQGSAPGKALILGEHLRSLTDRYDTCIIDCAPWEGLPALSALAASTRVLVPVQARSYALAGLVRLLDAIESTRDRFDPCTVTALGALVTFVEGRTTLSKRVEETLRERFGPLVFDTVIHKAVALAEAPRAGLPILAYAPTSKSAGEYRALAREVIERLDSPAGRGVTTAPPNPTT
jgi:chromosome partitioning protein